MAGASFPSLPLLCAGHTAEMFDSSLMLFIFVLFVVFILVLIVSIFDDGEDHVYMKWSYIGALALLTLMVGFRPIGIDNDSATYLSYYESVDVGVVELVEPSFHLISAIARLLDSPQFIFIIYALLAIPLKGYAISKLSSCWFLSLAVWMNNYFILHECTQIRAAVVGAIFLYALYYLVEGRKKVYLGLVVISIFFHYSALILIPLVFFGTRPINLWWRSALFIAPLFCYGVYMMGIDPITYIPVPFFQEKMEVYEMVRDKGIAEAINVFNLMALFRLGAYYFILWKCDEIYKECGHIYLMLKIMCISICFYAFFGYMPAMAIRSSELFGVVDILILPTIMYAVKPEMVVKLVLAVVCIGLFTMNIVVNEYLKFDI